MARIELVGQPTKLGATTTEGVIFLNDKGATGACRVHYFLGGDVITEDGVVTKLGGIYAKADIDLKTQSVPVLLRELTAEDQLVALTMEGSSVSRTVVQLANDDIAEGHVLQWPGRELAAGSAIFRIRTGQNAGALQFVGLANGIATLTANGRERRYITFTGPTRMREALATPIPIFPSNRIKHRPDGISVRK